MDIPPEIEILTNDLIWARYYYNEYKKLYAVSELRVSLLNEIAPSFFRLIQDMLWDQMILSLARLTDPYVKGSNRNLSAHVLQKLATENHWSFTGEISNLLKEVDNISKSIFNRRNKLIGHRDLLTALSAGVVQDHALDVTLNQTEKVLDLIGKAINLVYHNLINKTFMWNFGSDRDVNDLIYHLKLAVIYKEITENEKDWMKESELRHSSKYFNA